MKHNIPTKRLIFYNPQSQKSLPLPYLEEGVSAGFPSPAEDFEHLSIDLNKEIIKNKEATFYARVKGSSMKDAGIDDGDILVIDKSIAFSNKRIAVCFIDGEFTVKRILIDKKGVCLLPENKSYKPLYINASNEFIIWGIVTTVIKFV